MRDDGLNIGRRRWILVGLLAAGFASIYALDLQWSQLLPNAGGIHTAGQFFARALSPALSYESAVPLHTPPLLIKALAAAWQTILFAAAALSLALVGGAVLGFFASTALWLPAGAHEPSSGRPLGAALLGVMHALIRLLITLMRSVHELLWAVLFLAAFGLSQMSAVIALALPCAGILAKIFAELVDEAPSEAAYALRAAGASRLQVFCFALIPCAMPDILAYVLYRFECLLRTSAVLGFFGFPTLGFYIAAAFENLHYGELWSYLYTLLILIVIADWWSGLFRRELLR